MRLLILVCAEVVACIVILCGTYYCFPEINPRIVPNFATVMDATACVVLAFGLILALLADAEHRVKYWWEHRHLNLPTRRYAKN